MRPLGILNLLIGGVNLPAALFLLFAVALGGWTTDGTVGGAGGQSLSDHWSARALALFCGGAMIALFASGFLLVGRNRTGLRVAFYATLVYLTPAIFYLVRDGADFQPRFWWFAFIPYLPGGFLFFLLYVLFLIFYMRTTNIYR